MGRTGWGAVLLCLCACGVSRSPAARRPCRRCMAPRPRSASARAPMTSARAGIRASPSSSRRASPHPTSGSCSRRRAGRADLCPAPAGQRRGAGGRGDQPHLHARPGDGGHPPPALAGDPRGTPPTSGCADLTPTLHITGTPVIDTTNPASVTAYFVTKGYQSGTSGPAGAWMLSAVDVPTLVERPDFPVLIQGAADNQPTSPSTAPPRSSGRGC